MLGKYVKRFESGKSGALTVGSCGYDWGLSCGSYQLTLRWGNAINFLKRYFPEDTKNLHFNKYMKDVKSKEWPGAVYCSSPEVVRATWLTCVNKYGKEEFEKKESEYIKELYYDPLAKKVKFFIDLDECGDRGLQECFWSWAVHRGVGGAYSEFSEMLKTTGMTEMPLDHETLFDAIYDMRYSKVKVPRYGTGEDSEREILRPLVTQYDDKSILCDPEVDMIPIGGTARVIARTGAPVYEKPNHDSILVETLSYGTTKKISAHTPDGGFYMLEDGAFVAYDDVQFFPAPVHCDEYQIRADTDDVEVLVNPYMDSETNGTLHKNAIYTIDKELIMYAHLKSGAGWIYLDPCKIKRVK